ncbi:MAG TPA: FHA domain-containing protein [Planctomycetota bacterium]|nr:FHA domain-containing protein [Planctomycetota bacterium]
MPRFIVQFQGQESVAELKPGANSVGRQSTNSIPLKDSTLSRLHCEVILAGTVATLVDKGSRNGTLLNGKKIDAQVLQPGDKIQIGATTLWYEKKNVALEKPPPPKAAPEPAAAPPAPVRSAPPPSTRRASAGEGKPGTGGVRPVAASAAIAQIPDYSFHGKAGGNAGKIVAALVVVALLGVGGYYLRAFLDRPATVDVDLDNLITKNPHFDLSAGGKPDGWAMRPSLSGEKSSCTAGIDATRGRNGSPGLLLDKAAGSGDLVAECGYQDDLALPKGSAVNVSAWAQFDAFGGWAAAKIDWLKSPRGAVIAEEYSDPVKPAGWSEIRATFNPPTGAGAFRFSLAILGRGGRVFFDDVRVKTQPGAPAGPEKKIGPYHKVAWTRAGLLQLELRGGRRVLTNIGCRLDSEKEGATPQAFASDVAATPDDTGVSFKGRLVSPVDFKEIPFEERVGQVDGMTTFEYSFPGEVLKQVDRVTVAITLPRVDGPPKLPESGEPVSRINCAAEDGEFAIEYSEPARVRFRNIDGRIRLYQTWTVDPGVDTVTFRIREAGGGGEVFDPVGELTRLRGRGKLGEAITLAREAVKKLREAPVREKMEGDIRALEEQERRDWVEAQAQAFQARISRRSDISARAGQVLGTYLRQWSGEGTEAKADKLLKEMNEELRSTPPAEAERPKRIFDRAKKLVEGGKRALAQSLLQTLVARYPSSEVAPEAQQLLKTLSE